MKRLLLVLSTVAMLLAPAVPASARDHGRSGGNGTTTAILAGVGGLAVGALATSVIQHRSQARNQSYQQYPQSYQQQSYATPSYQQPAYQQPAYQQPSYPQPSYQQPYQSDVTGYGYPDGGAVPVQHAAPAYRPVAPRGRPAPGGVRCLMWNGEGYVPGRC